MLDAEVSPDSHAPNRPLRSERMYAHGKRRTVCLHDALIREKLNHAQHD
jgi:hypothetical protein